MSEYHENYSAHQENLGFFCMTDIFDVVELLHFTSIPIKIFQIKNETISSMNVQTIAVNVAKISLPVCVCYYTNWHSLLPNRSSLLTHIQIPYHNSLIDLARTTIENHF